MMSQLVKHDVELAGSRVLVHITATNPSHEHALFLEKKKILALPPVRIDLFHVSCEGLEIPYIGPLAKTKAPGRDDFFRVNPASEIKGYADITDLYAFRPGDHTYTITYDSFHGDPNDEAKLLEITSPPTNFRLHI